VVPDTFVPVMVLSIVVDAWNELNLCNECSVTNVSS
jgi:hypothetical protein